MSDLNEADAADVPGRAGIDNPPGNPTGNPPADPPADRKILRLDVGVPLALPFDDRGDALGNDGDEILGNVVLRDLPVAE